jgi:DNA primase
MNNNQNSSSNEWERRVRKARTIPIQAMCQRLGIELPKKGKNGSFYGICPLCDDEGHHFHISPKKAEGRGLYYCFECGSGGDSLSLHMQVRKLTFPESVRALA